MKILRSHELLKGINSVYGYFPPHPPIPLSVVSMEMFVPHKMAEIRASAWQRGGLDPRMYLDQGILETSEYIVVTNASWAAEDR